MYFQRDIYSGRRSRRLSYFLNRNALPCILFSCSLSGATLNVKDFGAKGDCNRVMDGVIASGSPQLTSASAHFGPADAGKSIYILDAAGDNFQGKPVKYGRLPLESVIAKVVDAHTVTLSIPAQSSVKGVSVTWGTDDTDAIQKAIESAAKAGGGTVFFPAGTYRVTTHSGGGFGVGFRVDGSNVHLTGTGDSSKILNSSVHPFMSAGTDYYHLTGVSVMFIGRDQAISNIEVDHLWFGDNGEQFLYAIAGSGGNQTVANPEGPGVIGTFGVISNVRLHDITVVTRELCGINTDAKQSSEISISRVRIESNGGNHGLYLAGNKNGLTVSNSVITSRTTPMRIGIVVKGGSHIEIRNNRIENFFQQGIGLDANSQEQALSNVSIIGNTITNPTAPSPGTSGAAQQKGVNTHGIQANNGIDIVVANNHISVTNYSGVYIGVGTMPIRNFVVRDNVISDTAVGVMVAGARGQGVTVGKNSIRNASVCVQEYGAHRARAPNDDCVEAPSPVKKK